MDVARGILMLALGGFVFYRGTTMHDSRAAWFAYALGVLSIALGVYRVTRKSSRPLS